MRIEKGWYVSNTGGVQRLREKISCAEDEAFIFVVYEEQDVCVLVVGPMSEFGDVGHQTLAMRCYGALRRQLPRLDDVVCAGSYVPQRRGSDGGPVPDFAWGTQGVELRQEIVYWMGLMLCPVIFKMQSNDWGAISFTNCFALWDEQGGKRLSAYRRLLALIFSELDQKYGMGKWQAIPTMSQHIGNLMVVVDWMVRVPIEGALVEPDPVGSRVSA